MEVSRGGMSGASKTTENALRSTPYNVFEMPRYNTAYVDKTETTYYADNIKDYGPQRIQIFGNNLQYLDLSRARITYKLKLCLENGDPVPKWHDMSVVPLGGSSLWKSVNVSINNIDIPELTQDFYAHKVFCETILSYGTEACLSSIASRHPVFDNPGFYVDDEVCKNFGSKAAAAAEAQEANKKSLVTKKARSYPFWQRNSFYVDLPDGVEIVTPLHLDIFQSETYIPPNTNIGLKFNRNPKSFSIISKETDGKYEIRLVSMAVSVPFRTIDPAIHLAHEKMFASGKQAVVVFEKVVPHTRQFSANETQLDFHQLSQGTLPKAAYVMMFNTEEFDGKINASPYVMRHNNMSEVTFKIDNVISLPVIETDFNSGTNFAAHNQNMVNLGITGNQSILLFEGAFNNDYTMIVKDFSPDGCAGYHLHDPNKLANRGQGTLDLSIKLKSGLDKPTTLLVFLTYNRAMFIDQYRHVTFQTI